MGGHVGRELGTLHPRRGLSRNQRRGDSTAHPDASLRPLPPSTVSPTIRNRLTKLLHQRQILERERET